MNKLNEAPQVFYTSSMTCNSRRRVSRTDKIESNERQYTVEFDCRSLAEAQELHRWFVEVRQAAGPIVVARIERLQNLKEEYIADQNFEAAAGVVKAMDIVRDGMQNLGLTRPPE